MSYVVLVFLSLIFSVNDVFEELEATKTITSFCRALQLDYSWLTAKGVRVDTHLQFGYIQTGLLQRRFFRTATL